MASCLAIMRDWSPTSDVPKSVCRVVSCSFPNSIRMTQTSLLRTCRGIFPNHLDMSRWFETPKLHRDIPMSHDTRRGMSPGRRRNEVWAKRSKARQGKSDALLLQQPVTMATWTWSALAAAAAAVVLAAADDLTSLPPGIHSVSCVWRTRPEPR